MVTSLRLSRLQQILIGVLVLQLALAAFVLWPRPAAGGGGEPLLPGIATGDITGLTITGETGAPPIRLAKQGEAWIAPDAGDFPVDATKVSPVLDKLVAIKTGRLVAQTPASHAQLQVAADAFARRVEIATAAGTQTLYLGSSAGGSSIHVRLDGQDNVYLAGGLSTWEVSAELLSWVNPVYVAINSSDVTGFTLENRNGEFAFVKDAQGNWTLTGLAANEVTNSNNVVSQVDLFTGLRMTQPLGKTDDPAYRMTAPSAVVTLHYKSGEEDKTTTVTIGAQDPADRAYYVKSSDSPYYVKVAEYSVATLVERGRADFLQGTPTPAPTPAQ